ncbi:endonuclease domain-containing 1 protein-like [Thunnus albacares]|uniref:endonuclease domain-containing 1 protein-like n=1 Tax=Thunnus albacares TaxID=8236 RepID=UPI001CF64184|nr:endonuclease domain-containing 1 protein-like [Thunnus albacares]
MKLLVSAFLLLVLSYPATAEVVDSTPIPKDCLSFFSNGQPPIGPSGVQYKMICQKTEDGYEYATLYDTNNKIPVYSAYEFQGKRSKTSSWDIEPQLDDQNGGEFMASEGTVRNGLGQRQAVNEDYKKSNYDRGHLLPVNHRHTKSSADATFTLTNAAPQHPTFNRGIWKVTESEVVKTLINNCLMKNLNAHIVTGVVPGSTYIGQKKDVNVPSHFWTAYCCRDNNIPKESGAFYGTNDDSKKVVPMQIANLDAKLGGDYGVTGFKVFSDECQ